MVMGKGLSMVSRYVEVPVRDGRPGGSWSTKKPGAMAGFSSIRVQQRATAYPAECRFSGRRARDVMPDAMRALVRTLAV